MVSGNHPLRDQQVFAALPKIHQQPESSGTTEFVAVPRHAHTISEPYPATSQLQSGQQPMHPHPQRLQDKHSHPHPKHDQHHHPHHHHHHPPNPSSPYSHHQNHRLGHDHGENTSQNHSHLSQHQQGQISANDLAAKLGNLENQQQHSKTQDNEKIDPGSHQPTRPSAKVLAFKDHYDPSISSSSSPSSTSVVSSTSTQFSELQQRGEKVLNSILERLDQNSADLTMASSDDSVRRINANTSGMEGRGETSAEKTQKRISPELLKDQQLNLQQHHGSANLRHS